MNLLDLICRQGPWWVMVNENDGPCCEPSLDPRDLKREVNQRNLRGPFVLRAYETKAQAEVASIHHRIGEHGRVSYDGEILHKSVD